MASLKRLPSGLWQVQIAKTAPSGRKIRKSKSFNTKQEASQWAAREEYLISQQSSDLASSTTLAELLDRYARTVSIHKKGVRWEQIRLKKFAAIEFTHKPLNEIMTTDFAVWRDSELARGQKANSVRRELNIFSSVYSVARKEWGFDVENPISNLKKPKPDKPRFRRIDEAEIERLAYVAGYSEDGAVDTAAKRMYIAFLFAIETAMRAGEITSLRGSDISGRTALLRDTKNDDARAVPLSSRAMELLDKLDPDRLFDFKGDQISALFAKYKKKADLDDIHFHDTRHEAITRLAKKLHVLDLARMTGHRDLKKLMIYYNESAEDIAKRLD